MQLVNGVTISGGLSFGTLSPTDPNFNQVSLLVSGSGSNNATNTTFIDDSTNNFTVTRVGTVTQGSFSPYNNLWSNYFDGNGDYFLLPDSTAWAFGTGDFTIECWLYLNSATLTGSDDQRIFSQYDNDVNGSVVTFRVVTAGNLNFTYVTGGATQFSLSSPGILSSRTWVHVAVVRSVNTYTLYINGTASGTTTNSASIVDMVATPSIGALYRASPAGVIAGTYVAGYISNLRVVKGTAVYTGNFTPSIVPLTAITNTQLLTCQSNRLIDNSTNNFTVTKNGDVIVSPLSPFSPQSPYSVPINSSVSFDGTTDFLSAPSSTAFDIFSGDFTVEFFVYFSGATNNQTLFQIGIDEPNRANISLLSGSIILFTKVSGTGATRITATAPAINAWHHVAWVKSSTTTTLYVNGVSVGTPQSSVPYPSGSMTAGIGADQTQSGATCLLGNISNVRVLKGTALYTANFTPPTTPLTAITNTQLLTCRVNQIIDESTNNFTITVNGNSAVSSYNPFTQYSPTFSSGFFEGNGDNLSIANNTALNLSSGDFTIDGWVYPSRNNIYILDKDGVSGSTYPSYSVTINGTNNITVNLGSGNGITSLQTINSTGTVALNAWNYFAVVKSGTTITIFINGQSSGSTTQTATITDGGKPLLIGYQTGQGAATYFQGSMTNIRVIKGTALYSASFTPPPIPSTAVTNTQLLLNFRNPNIIDYTFDNNIEVLGSAKISTVVSKWGTGSLFFNGSTDYLSVPSNVTFNVGTGNFTIEAWIYTATIAAGQGMIVGRQETGTAAVFQFRRNAATVELLLRATSGTGLVTVSTGNVLTTNTWYHVAAVRSGTGITIYINGTSQGTGTSATNPNPTVARPLTIGVLDDTSLASYFSGYMSDIRFTPGVARYTANFTPPSTPLQLY